MKLYVPTIVRELKNHYKEYLHDIKSYPNIHTHLEALAICMYDGIKNNHACIKKEISNYHKDYLGKEELIKPHLFKLEDCKQAIANEYGFPNWLALEKLSKDQYNYNFEKAVNLLISGNINDLKKLITEESELLSSRSQYGHQATLLHYAASNGVEFWRQQVPLNLPEIVEYLLKAGVDKTATMKVYGGEYDTYALLTTSIHPLKAGVMNSMVEILKPE